MQNVLTAKLLTHTRIAVDYIKMRPKENINIQMNTKHPFYWSNRFKKSLSVLNSVTQQTTAAVLSFSLFGNQPDNAMGGAIHLMYTNCAHS